MIGELIIAGCGGIAGTAGRYIACRWPAGAWRGAFPLDKLLVNVALCFVAGLVFGLLERAGAMSAGQNLLLTTCFCGGFAAFSSFTADMPAIASRGAWRLCALYLASSIVLGITALWTARALAL